MRLPLFLVLLLSSFAFADVDAVLNQLHTRGADLKSMAADVKLMTRDSDLGDDDWDANVGTMVLERKPDDDTRVRVTFTERTRGKRTEKARRDYVIDGPSLVDRDWKAKKQTTRIVRRPGEKLDLFKLGEGPFPMPLGQKPEDVRKEFTVKPAAPEKPTAGVTYIELTPIAGSPMAQRFSRVTVGVNSDGWPVEVETSDKNAVIVTRAVLSNIRVNNAVAGKEFELEPIDDSWDKIDVPYQ